MEAIRRIPGAFTGRSSGVVYGPMGWAVATSETESDDVQIQTASALSKLDRVLGEMGTDKTRLLSATVYLTDITRKQEMDQAWCDWIGSDPQHWPQRACVEAGLHRSDLVEIVVLAAC